jgi:hypothetical protein
MVTSRVLINEERNQLCGADSISIWEKMGKNGPHVNIVRGSIEQKAKEELQICVSTYKNVREADRTKQSSKSWLRQVT